MLLAEREREQDHTRNYISITFTSTFKLYVHIATQYRSITKASYMEIVMGGTMGHFSVALWPIKWPIVRQKNGP